MIDASIIIRTKNESAHIGETLTAVLAQSPPPAEVLVVDSGSTDSTISIAESFGVDVFEMDPAEWSYPRALNLGAMKTSGSVIVCLSAHCVPASDRWLYNLTRHFEDPNVAGAWGPSIDPRLAIELDQPSMRQRPGTYTYATRRWGLDNANSAIRRSLWEQFPFDERLPATEDKAWGMEAMNRGFDLVCEPAAAVSHETHGVRAAYRRAVSVAEGYNAMFPEERRHGSGGLGNFGRAAGNSLSRNAHSPSFANVRKDFSRALASMATLAGLYVGSRDKSSR